MISFVSSSSKETKLKRLQIIEKLISISKELLLIQLSVLGDSISDISVTVMELKCTEINCPPLETAFVVLDKGVDCKFKVLKELEKVQRDDIVDAIQSWVRGDAPECGCEIPSLSDETKGEAKNTSTPDISSDRDEAMQMFMQNLENGVL
jgi:hypothetical protein